MHVMSNITFNERESKYFLLVIIIIIAETNCFKDVMNCNVMILLIKL